MKAFGMIFRSYWFDAERQVQKCNLRFNCSASFWPHAFARQNIVLPESRKLHGDIMHKAKRRQSSRRSIAVAKGLVACAAFTICALVWPLLSGMTGGTSHEAADVVTGLAATVRTPFSVPLTLEKLLHHVQPLGVTLTIVSGAI